MAHTQVTFKDTVLMHPGNYHTNYQLLTKQNWAYKGMFCTNTKVQYHAKNLDSKATHEHSNLQMSSVQ